MGEENNASELLENEESFEDKENVEVTSEEKVIEYGSESSGSPSHSFSDIPHDSDKLDSVMNNFKVLSDYDFSVYRDGSYGNTGSSAFLLSDGYNAFGKLYCLSSYGTKLWYRPDVDSKWVEFDSTKSIQFTAARTYVIDRKVGEIQEHIYRIDENICNTNGLLLANCLLTGGILFYLAFTTVFKTFFKHWF